MMESQSSIVKNVAVIRFSAEVAGQVKKIGKKYVLVTSPENVSHFSGLQKQKMVKVDGDRFYPYSKFLETYTEKGVYGLTVLTDGEFEQRILNSGYEEENAQKLHKFDFELVLEPADRKRVGAENIPRKKFTFDDIFGSFENLHDLTDLDRVFYAISDGRVSTLNELGNLLGIDPTGHINDLTGMGWISSTPVGDDVKYLVTPKYRQFDKEKKDYYREMRNGRLLLSRSPKAKELYEHLKSGGSMTLGDLTREVGYTPNVYLDQLMQVGLVMSQLEISGSKKRRTYSALVKSHSYSFSMKSI